MLRAKKSKEKEIYLVFGGSHLLQTPDHRMKEILKSFRDLKIRYVGPSHCTGHKQIDMFRKEFGDDFVEMGVGKVVKLQK